MLPMKLSPSMMCADLSRLSETVQTFETAGIDHLHVDIMDGEFVPNFTLGVDFCEDLRALTTIPLDIHLMIEKPENKLDWFCPRPGEYMSVHAESTSHLHRTLSKIHTFGAKAMVAINPATPFYGLEDVLDDLDAVLVMTVDPGYSGQSLIHSTLNKIRRLRQFLDDRGYEKIEIEVDGNVSFAHASTMRQAGANIFVAGSSSVFSKAAPIRENIQTLYRCLGGPDQ